MSSTFDTNEGGVLGSDESTGSLKHQDNPFGRILMHMKGAPVSVVLTEGVDDKDVLKVFIPEVDIFPLAGRVNVLKARDYLIDKGGRNFVCVYDRDFDMLTVSMPGDGPDYPYEESDMESHLLMTDLLSRMVEKSGVPERIQAAGGMGEVLNSLLEKAKAVGRVRARSQELSWGINFDNVPMERCFDLKDMQFDAEKFALLCVQNASGSPKVSAAEVARELSSRNGSGGAFRGKDFILILSLSLRKYLGSSNKSRVAVEVLTDQLHLAGGYVLASSNWGAGLVDRMKTRSS